MAKQTVYVVRWYSRPDGANDAVFSREAEAERYAACRQRPGEAWSVEAWVVDEYSGSVEQPEP